MHSPIYTWPYAPVFWLALIWAVLPEFLLVQRSLRSVGPQDAGSLRLIAYLMRAALPIALVLPFVAPQARLPGDPILLLSSGVALMAGGALFRRHCFRMLGQHFQGAVTALPGQPVIERGAYRWIRHPSYSAGALVTIGIAVATGNVVSLMTMALALVLGYGYRIHAEERALIETIGQPYVDYMARTKRLVPFLF